MSENMGHIYVVVAELNGCIRIIWVIFNKLDKLNKIWAKLQVSYYSHLYFVEGAKSAL